MSYNKATFNRLTSLRVPREVALALSDDTSPLVPNQTPSTVGIRKNSFSASSSAYNWKASNTRRLHASLGKAAAGTGLASHAFIGDSLTAGAINGTAFDRQNSYPVSYRKMLNALGYTTAGDGIVPAGTWPTGTGGVIDGRWTNTGSWTNTGGYLHVGANNTTLTFTSLNTGTSAFVWSYGGSGSFTVAIDGGSAVAPTRSGGFAIDTYNVTGLSNATHTITINTTSATDVAIFGAAVVGTAGLVVHNLGVFGSTADIWANSTSDLTLAQVANRTMLNSIPPQVVFVELGANDLTGGATVAQIKANLTTLVGFYSGTADVILSTPTQATAVSTANIQALVSGIYDVADALDLPLFDLYHRTGGFTVASANGLMGTDNTHMLGAGYRDWGAAMAGLVTR